MVQPCRLNHYVGGRMLSTPLLPWWANRQSRKRGAGDQAGQPSKDPGKGRQ